MKRVYLARHAESQKNVIDMHGGHGGILTCKGRAEALEIANQILRREGSVDVIAYVPVVQCQETAVIVAEKLGLKPLRLSMLSPLNLGIFDGLTSDEMKSLDPAAYERLEDWRMGKIELIDLNIPEGEDVGNFWERGLLGVNTLLDLGNKCIFLGTRSTCILLHNIFSGCTIFPGGGYRAVDFSNAEYFVFNQVINGWVKEE